MQTGCFEHTSDHIKKIMIKWFLEGGYSFQKQSDVIGNEVLFSTHRRRCDLLVMNENFHAFEIKGSADNLSKLSGQVVDYRKTFDFVSIVTTIKHIKKIVRVVPNSVGIVTIDSDRVEIQRLPRKQTTLNKDALLMFLGRQELLAFLRHQNVSRLSLPPRRSVGELRHLAARKYSVSMIRESAYKTIKKTYTPLFQRFLRETENYPIMIDDIRSLSASVAAPIPLNESDIVE